MNDSPGPTGLEKLRKASAYPVVYMALVTGFFSSILIGFSSLTDERVKGNRRISFERAVLVALDLPVSEKTPAAEVHALFADKVAPPTPESGGTYRLKGNDQAQAYALPIEGKGFWNTIRGVIGINPDGQSIRGIAFYEQNETPGLGAEILKPYFRDQFKGLRLAVNGKPITFKAVGSELTAGQVQAITGATQTCGKLESIVNRALKTWKNSRTNHPPTP